MKGLLGLGLHGSHLMISKSQVLPMHPGTSILGELGVVGRHNAKEMAVGRAIGKVMNPVDAILDHSLDQKWECLMQKVGGGLGVFTTNGHV